MTQVHEYLGVKFKIIPDPDPTDPRKEYDHPAVMACEHRRYNLGDKDGTADLTYAIRKSRYYRDTWEDEESRYYRGDASDVSGIVKLLPLCKDILAQPLYLYDHSGITISTGAFSCPWDSGQVGYIFMTREAVLKTFGFKTLSVKARRAAIECMDAEVEEYDAYLTGDVYGYEVGDDSCWGYIGEKSCIEAAHEVIDSLGDEGRAALIASQAEEPVTDDDEDQDQYAFG